MAKALEGLANQTEKNPAANCADAEKADANICGVTGQVKKIVAAINTAKKCTVADNVDGGKTDGDKEGTSEEDSSKKTDSAQAMQVTAVAAIASALIF